MILSVLLAAFAAFLIENRLIHSSGYILNRQGLTGAEITRGILDLQGLRQTAVEISPARGDTAPGGFRQIYLERDIYEGKTLLALALAARLAVLKSRPPQALAPFPVSAHKKFRGFCMMLINLAWAVFVVTALAQGNRPTGFATWILGLSFLMGCMELPLEWEIAGSAFRCLKESRHFEVDELFRLKRILEGLRFQGLSLIIHAPLSMVRRVQ